MNSARLICAIQSSPLWISPRSASGDRDGSLLADSVDAVSYWRRYRRTNSRAFGIEECITEYLEHAGAQLLSPNLAFDEFWYRHEYPEADALIRAGKYQSGWEHYLGEGIVKRYNPVFWFDERWYGRRNIAIETGITTGSLACGFEHYLLYGIQQDLTPSIYFNTHWYREQYMQEVAGGPRSYPVVHYLLQDSGRRLCPVPFFDPAWYAQQYTSTLTHPQLSEQKIPAYEHYLLFGRRLGYSPSPFFNESAYRDIPQVRATLNAGLYASGFEHYVAEGPTNGFHAPTHLPHSGVDYTGPEYLKHYEQSLLLHLTQMKKLSDLAEQ